MADLASLRERLERAEGPLRELDLAIARALCPDVIIPRSHEYPYPYTLWRYTEKVDDALALVERLLPGFWVTCGLCALTGHASIGPDYNGPDGDRLRREWPEEKFHSGFDSDLAPGDGWHRTCLAILCCALAALEAKEGGR